MIDVKELKKSYYVHRKEPGLLGSLKSLVVRRKEEKQAVRGVSFHIGEGELVGLIGANGAGKTTIVKMLTGIIHPTGGEARVLGHDPWKRDNEFRRQIALIMGQKAQLWWDLPAADCFLLLREIYQVPKTAFEQRLEMLSTVLEVRSLLNIQIRRLSLGERMKMELIAALLHNPRVVFLDEPTIGLDVNAQRSMREFLLSYQAEHQPAMILTSHYMEDIERLCKRVMIIRQGELVYDGSLQEVVRRYVDYKVLTAHFSERSAARPTREDVEKLGEVVELTETEVKLHVPRGSVAEAASHLMSHWQVSDLNIEEEEITAIVQAILSERGELRK